jgi:hypothetical protein
MGLTVSIPELEAQWRPIPDEQVAKATALIQRAISLLRLRLPGLDARVDENSDLMVVAKGVVIDMIKRALPADGDDTGGGEVSQHLQVAGAFTDQKLFRTASKNLYVLDQDIALLSRRGARRVGTIYTPPAR